MLTVPPPEISNSTQSRGSWKAKGTGHSSHQPEGHQGSRTGRGPVKMSQDVASGEGSTPSRGTAYPRALCNPQTEENARKQNAEQDFNKTKTEMSVDQAKRGTGKEIDEAGEMKGKKNPIRKIWMH